MDALKFPRLHVLVLVICVICLPSVAHSQSADDLAKGLSLMRKGDFGKAASHFQKMTIEHPEWADGWLYAGYALHLDGNSEKSIPFYRRALALNPESKKAEFWLQVAERHDLAEECVKLLKAEDYPRAATWIVNYASNGGELKLLYAVVQLNFQPFRREWMLFPSLTQELIKLEAWDTARTLLGFWMTESAESRLSALSYDALISLKTGNRDRGAEIVKMLQQALDQPDGSFAIDSDLAAELSHELGMEYTEPKPLRRTVPSYTEDALNAKFEGILVFFCRIDKDGKAKDISLISPKVNYGLAESSAWTIAQQWVFQPATINGKPAAIRAEIEVRFSLSEW